MKVFTTAQLGKDYSGLKRFVLETVTKAGGVPCPPIALGIGIGGQMDVACRLSRRAVSTRRWDDTNPDRLYASLESETVAGDQSFRHRTCRNGRGHYSFGSKNRRQCYAYRYPLP